MKTIALILLLLAAQWLPAQKCADINIQLQADIPATCNQLPMTMRQDAADRPYLYVAHKEAGLEVYDITNLASPVLKKTIAISTMNNLHVMNVSQTGNYLYLALGNHFTNSQTPGIAIVDVTDPVNAALKDVWVSPYPDGGAGIVIAEGDYAYVGAMKNGLVILDIKDKTDIKFVSRMVPDINYPTPNPNPDLYNARGMVVKNGTVYLCYDAGGLRIINTADKQNPVETGRYSNPVMNGKPRAYNNIVLDDTLAYIAADYCGLEVLSIASPSSIKQVSWWNPWNCQGNPGNWFTSAGHANEIEMDKNNNWLFISTGKGDMHVVDVANPKAPDSCSNYGGTLNGIGTWGVGLHKDRIFLSYICAVIPFSSNWTGVKILTYKNQQTTGIFNVINTELKITPNPAKDILTIETLNSISSLQLLDKLGRVIHFDYFQSENKTYVNVEKLPTDIYVITAVAGNKILRGKFVKE